jgi:hypothetical protein
MIGLVVLAAVLVAGLVVVSRDDGGPAPASAMVVLEGSTDPGADPFTSSVAISEVSVFPASVSAVSADVRGGLETDVATGTLVAVGSTTPGLYGGSEEEVCRPDELVSFLEGDAAKASAWAGVFGIDPGTIGEFVGGLTPVVLTSDTWVTNHGFAGGVATARQSVLQAGTAVLVDSTGVPRVKCSCGNPLLEPTREQLSGVQLVGDPWEGYDPATVTVVDPGIPTETFTVVDIETGDTFQQPTGGERGETELAPDGLGPLAIGMSPEEVNATGFAVFTGWDFETEGRPDKCGGGTPAPPATSSDFYFIATEDGVDLISVRSTAYRTSDDLGVGSTRAEVEAALGAPTQREPNAYTPGETSYYRFGDNGLAFQFDPTGVAERAASGAWSGGLFRVEGCL